VFVPVPVVSISVEVSLPVPVSVPWFSVLLLPPQEANVKAPAQQRIIITFFIALFFFNLFNVKFPFLGNDLPFNALGKKRVACFAAY
jgi:hypothetical protein